MDALELHGRAVAATGSMITERTAEELTASTPCSEWTARGVIEHMVGNALGVPERLGVADAVAPRLGDTDPRQAFGTALVFARGVFAAADLDRPFDFGAFGALPGEFLIRVHFADVLLHGWDLAVAAGRSPELDVDLAAAAFDFVSTSPEIPELRGAGRPFAPIVPVPADAPVVVRLLGHTGRNLAWA